MKNKSAPKDYDINLLPRTRKEQFSDILKHHFLDLMKIGLLLLLCAFPLLISLVIRDIGILGIQRLSAENQSDIDSMKFYTQILFYGLEFISILFFSIGISGSLKVLKQLIYGEPLFLKEDFIQGIKENIKGILLITFIFALVTFLGNMVFLVSTWMQVNVFISVIPFAINVGIIYPILFIACFLVVTYKNSFSVNVKTSFVFYIKFFPPQIGLCFLISLLIFLKLIPAPYFYIEYILLILLLEFYYPMQILFMYLYQVEKYDEYINKYQFKEFYKKGLFEKQE